MAERVGHPDTIDQWQTHAQFLASTDETGEPIVSCFLNLDMPRQETRSYLFNRVENIIRAWSDHPYTASLRDALSSALQQALRTTDSDVKGVAVFARSGRYAFNLPMRFQVPLPTSLIVDTIPHLHPLTRLCNQEAMTVLHVVGRDNETIFEVNTDSARQELELSLTSDPMRSIRQWSCLRYQNRYASQGRRSDDEKAAVLERIISHNRDARLAFVGDRRSIEDAKRHLDSQLRWTSIEEIARSGATQDSLLAEGLRAFMLTGGQTAQDPVQHLLATFRRDEMAALGITDTLNAMFSDQASSLIMAEDIELGSAYMCRRCVASSPVVSTAANCPECGCSSVRQFDVREELLRLAEKNECPVEAIGQREELRQIGGVGCLLRYARPEPVGRSY